MKFTWGFGPLIMHGVCKHGFVFCLRARYTRAVWRKAHKAKKENSEGTWPLWVEGVVKELFETMQPSATDDLAKSWGLPDPHLELNLRSQTSIFSHANLVNQLHERGNFQYFQYNFQPCVFKKANPS